MSDCSGQILINRFGHYLGYYGDDRRYLKGIKDGTKDGKGDRLKGDRFGDYCFLDCGNYGPSRNIS